MFLHVLAPQVSINKQADADEKGDGADCGTGECFRIIFGKRNDRKENDDATPTIVAIIALFLDFAIRS